MAFARYFGLAKKGPILVAQAKIIIGTIKQ